MPVFDTLARAEFAGLQFPVKRIRIRGGLRLKQHEYPHAPGAAIEKLGRKPYEIELEPVFDARVRGYDFRQWPEVPASLRSYFERGVTDTLVIPTIGKIQAVAASWEETATSKRLSGVDATLHFIEDQTELFIVDEIIQVAATDIGAFFSVLVIAADNEGFQLDAFLAIKGLVDQILAYADAVDLQADLIASKCEGIASLCSQVDAQLNALSDPSHFRVLGALHDVWDASIKLQRDALRKAIPITIFVTPVAMSVSTIAAAVYGDASRAAEVMKMNAFADPLLVPAGTSVRIYAS